MMIIFMKLEKNSKLYKSFILEWDLNHLDAKYGPLGRKVSKVYLLS